MQVCRQMLRPLPVLVLVAQMVACGTTTPAAVEPAVATPEPVTPHKFQRADEGAPWERVNDPEAGISFELPPHAKRMVQLDGTVITWMAMASNRDRFVVMRVLTPAVGLQGLRDLAESVTEGCEGKLVAFRTTDRPGGLAAEFESTCEGKDNLVGSAWTGTDRVIGVMGITETPPPEGTVAVRRKLDGVIASFREGPAR